MNEQEYYTFWSKMMFVSLHEGGVWGVPRSGLIFQKARNKLVLIDLMPHDEGMPITADELLVQQWEDFKQIREEFAKADVRVSSGKFDVTFTEVERR
jgi:hypothetical protein